MDNIELHEILPSGMRPVKGSNQIHVVLSAGQVEQVAFELPNPGRGHTRVGPLLVRARDPLGLYIVEQKLDPNILAVMPRPEWVKGSDIRPGHLGPWAGTIPSRASGHGSEFYNLRAYVSGDDPKKINWKASARHNHFIVNETEAERVTDVMVALDTDVAFYEASERELFERSVRAAASMASLLLRQGNRVGLILQGQERGIVPPGFGKRQEKRILYMLADAKPGKAVIPTSYVVRLLARLLLPSNAQIVMITPLLDPEIVQGVAGLASDGYSILVITPMPGVPSSFKSESERVAFKVLMLERQNLMLGLEKVSTLVQWPTETPLSSRLRQARGRRIRPKHFMVRQR